MQVIVRDVASLDDLQRQTLECLLGSRLQSNQQLTIGVSEFAGRSTADESDDRPRQSLEDWTKVYEGLSEQQIEEIDRIANSRADLTRYLP